MLDIQRFGPPDFSGKITRYPVQWCAQMPIGSVASRREIKLRRIFERLETVIGRQWSHEIAVDWDTHVHYEEINAYAAHWGDEKVSLMENCTLVIDVADWSDRMRDLLKPFDPLWVNDRKFRDFGPAEIFNRRTLAERQAAKTEKEALLRELDAFDAEIRAV
jgi:hypothetical protein